MLAAPGAGSIHARSHVNPARFVHARSNVHARLIISARRDPASLVRTRARARPMATLVTTPVTSSASASVLWMSGRNRGDCKRGDGRDDGQRLGNEIHDELLYIPTTSVM